MSSKNKRKESSPAGRDNTSQRSGRPWLTRLNAFYGSYRLAIRSCIIFFVTVGLFIFIYSQIVVTPSFDVILNFTAGATAIVLNLAGMVVEVNGPVVSSSRFAFQIVDICTAIMPMMIFTAAILAFPSRLIEKILGLGLGMIGIFIINEVRLISLFYIGIYAPAIFDTTHLLVWQSLMILFALGLWLLWAYKYVRTASF
jgi:exosortase/archaeosortase family protein